MLELYAIVRSVVLRVWMLQGTTECNQLLIITIMELRKLSHSITINVLTIWKTIILVLIAFALILRLFLVFFLIVATLVKKWRVAIVEDVLRVWTDLPERLYESLCGFIDFRISIVECRVSLAFHRGIRVVTLRAQINVLSAWTFLVLVRPRHPLVIRIYAESRLRVL